MFSFHPEAEIEFESGLGEDFALEVASTIDRIIAHPKAWPIIEGDIRRCLTNRFPFGVLYSGEPDSIFILAVMHLHRRPDYWKNRK